MASTSRGSEVNPTSRSAAASAVKHAERADGTSAEKLPEARDELPVLSCGCVRGLGERVRKPHNVRENDFEQSLEREHARGRRASEFSREHREALLEVGGAQRVILEFERCRVF